MRQPLFSLHGAQSQISSNGQQTYQLPDTKQIFWHGCIFFWHHGFLGISSPHTIFNVAFFYFHMSWQQGPFFLILLLISNALASLHCRHGYSAPNLVSFAHLINGCFTTSSVYLIKRINHTSLNGDSCPTSLAIQAIKQPALQWQRPDLSISNVYNSFITIIILWSVLSPHSSSYPENKHILPMGFHIVESNASPVIRFLWNISQWKHEWIRNNTWKPRALSQCSLFSIISLQMPLPAPRVFHIIPIYFTLQFPRRYLQCKNPNPFTIHISDPHPLFILLQAHFSCGCSITVGENKKVFNIC